MSFRTFAILAGGSGFLGGMLFAALRDQPLGRVILLAVFTAALLGFTQIIRKLVTGQIRTALQNPLHIDSQGLFDDLFDPMLKGLILLLREKSDLSSRLAEVTSRFEGVLDHMVEGVAVTSPNAQILLVNTAFEGILEIPAGSAVGNRLGLVIRVAAIHQLIEEVFRTGTKVVREVEYNEGGKKKTLNVVATVSAPRDDSNKNYGIFLFYDVTTIRSLERIRKDFVANVSHEIRTPLTSIRGYAEALIDGAVSDPDLSRKFLGIISGQADRLSRMIDDLLELSRLESGTVNLKLEPIDLSVQADRMREVFSGRLKEKEMEFHADFPRPFPYVSDESMMDLVLTNLLDNAIKYSPPKRDVRIMADREEGGIRISIIDNGNGIPRDEIPRIFERFYRVDRSRSASGSGTGLGLSIVRHVLTLLHGRIEVKSEEGVGTTVRLYLPQKTLASVSSAGDTGKEDGPEEEGSGEVSL